MSCSVPAAAPTPLLLLMPMPSVNPMVMAVALNSGMSTGGLAPTSSCASAGEKRSHDARR